MRSRQQIVAADGIHTRVVVVVIIGRGSDLGVELVFALFLRAGRCGVCASGFVGFGGIVHVRAVVRSGVLVARSVNTAFLKHLSFRS